MQCPRCQQDNPSHAKFCLECGASVIGAAPIAARYADQKAEIETLRRSLTEADEQHAATSEILKLIARSPTDVRPVFDTLAERAMRLCDAKFSLICLYDGELLHIAVLHNVSPAHAAAMREAFPMPPDRGGAAARAVLTRAVVHIPDVLADPEYRLRRLGETTNARNALAVPLLRDGEPIGVITVGGDSARPFSERQIALLKTFADQAVIAIENVRLFNETKEALERQTATNEILQVISNSPTDEQPVFDTIAEHAVRLCDAAFGAVVRFDGEWINIAALSGLRPDERDAALRYFPSRPTPGGPGLSQVVQTGAAVHIPDVQVDPRWRAGSAGPHFSTVEGFRTFLAVPLMREGQCLGAVNVWRREVSPFSEQHIALLKTFADQAVIAIENVRLFTELQEKNRALTEAHAQVTESLEQQTATGEVLRVISSSPTDVQPVFDAVAESAARLCESFDSAIWRQEGDQLRLVAHHGAIPQTGSESFLPLIRSTVGGRSVLDGRTIHIADVQTEGDEFSTTSENARRQGFRTILSVPLMR